MLLELEVFLGVFSAGFDAGVAAEIDAFVLIIDKEFFVEFSVLHDGASDLGVGFFTAEAAIQVLISVYMKHSVTFFLDKYL